MNNKALSSIKTKIFLMVLIMSFAFFVRIVGLATHPIGFTPDEAAQGYTAYSLLTTGHDEWGKFWPINLRSYGDYKLPVYTYLTIPSIAVFGLDVFAVRLTSVVIGTLAVLTTFLLVRKLFSNERVALVSAFFLAISPWHIALSRGAFEANLTVFLLPMGIYLLLKGLERSFLLYLAAIFFGLNLFSYHSARFVTPFIILFLLIWKWQTIIQIWKKLIGPTIVLGIFGFVMFATFFTGGSTRVADSSVFNLGSTSDKQFIGQTMGENAKLARLFNNKLAFTLDAVSKNYAAYFSLDYLFAHGPGELTYGMTNERGVLYWYEILTIGIALFLFARQRSKSGFFLIFWLLVAAIPPALAKGSMAANRNAVAMPAWQIISAFGFITIMDRIGVRWSKYQKKSLIFGLFGCLVFFAIFFEDYWFHTPYYAAKSMQYGWQQAVDFIRANQNYYQHIVISRTLSEPQAQLAFFLPIPPTEFQSAAPDLLRYQTEGHVFVDQLGDYSIGKFEFKEIPQGLVPTPGTLYVGTAVELSNQPNKIHEIDDPDKSPAFIFVAK